MMEKWLQEERDNDIDVALSLSLSSLSISSVKGDDASMTSYQTATSVITETTLTGLSPVETSAENETNPTTDDKQSLSEVKPIGTSPTEISAEAEIKVATDDGQNTIMVASSTPRRAPKGITPTNPTTCLYMAKKGQCIHGDKCKFNHPKLCQAFINTGKCSERKPCKSLHPILCKYEKKCKLTSKRCKYLHIKSELKTKGQCPKQIENRECGVSECTYTHFYKCRYWMENGKCNEKNRGQCKYVHPVLCFESTRLRKCLDRECKLYHIKGTIRRNGKQKTQENSSSANESSAKVSHHHFPQPELASWIKTEIGGAFQQQMSLLTKHIETLMRPNQQTQPSPPTIQAQQPTIPPTLPPTTQH